MKVRGKMLACIPTNKSAEPDSMVVAIDFDQRAALLEEAPEIYYLPDHYKNYPGVLVRLSKIRRDALEGLLRGAWSFAAKKSSFATKKKPARRTGAALALLITFACAGVARAQPIEGGRAATPGPLAKTTVVLFRWNSLW